MMTEINLMKRILGRSSGSAWRQSGRHVGPDFRKSHPPTRSRSLEAAAIASSGS
jgi:hypothetical protein